MHSQRLTDGILVVIAAAIGAVSGGALFGGIVVVILDQFGVDFQVLYVILVCAAVASACYAAGMMVEECLKGRRYQPDSADTKIIEEYGRVIENLDGKFGPMSVYDTSILPYEKAAIEDALFRKLEWYVATANSGSTEARRIMLDLLEALETGLMTLPQFQPKIGPDPIHVSLDPVSSFIGALRVAEKGDIDPETTAELREALLVGLEREGHNQRPIDPRTLAILKKVAQESTALAAMIREAKQQAAPAS